KDINYIDSIAQGRVWSGQDALQLGLVDRIGNLQDAIASAARLAKLDEYGLKEYPESGSWIDEILDRKKTEPAALIRQEVGEENYRLYQQLKKIREITGVQARLPFEFIMN
ncbi:MAG TPA: S49 family peptidase, partial [Flavisolibacter sp.]|nr:S49 family peptidase [Flavisolibacter sp.]